MYKFDRSELITSLLYYGNLITIFSVSSYISELHGLQNEPPMDDVIGSDADIVVLPGVSEASVL